MLEGGKIILLCHVLNSMPLYLLQAVDPLKMVLRMIGHIFNSFLWDSSSWEILCFPMEEEALGFRSFENVTKAFGMKLWWSFTKQIYLGRVYA